MKPNKFQVFVVRRDSPAFQVITNWIEGELIPGQVISVEDEEFESFKNDFMVLEVKGNL